MVSPINLGVDLGGTKIEIVALDPCDPAEPLLRKRIPAPRGDYRATLEAIAGLVAEAERELARPGSVGIGIPGAISPASGLIKNANSLWLIGKAFDRDISHLLKREVRVANDADCLALSEARLGAGKDARCLFAAILGTGVGSGIVVEGRLLSGPNAIAGEWGHNPLPWPKDDERPGPLCYCGKHGCIETWLSGPALARDGALTSGEDVVAKARAGDKGAKAAIGRHEERLARALASVINILDPDLILLGGGLSALDHLYEGVPALWGDYVFSDSVATPLRRAALGDSSGVFGAALLWAPEEFSRALPA